MGLYNKEDKLFYCGLFGAIVKNDFSNYLLSNFDCTNLKINFYSRYGSHYIIFENVSILRKIRFEIYTNGRNYEIPSKLNKTGILLDSFLYQVHKHLKIQRKSSWSNDYHHLLNYENYIYYSKEIDENFTHGDNDDDDDDEDYYDYNSGDEPKISDSINFEKVKW